MPAPVNDNIANAIELVGAGGTETHVITDATMEVGEPLGFFDQSMWFYVAAPAARTRYDLDLSDSPPFTPGYAVAVYVYEASAVPATFADLGPETLVMSSDYPPPGAAFRAEAGQDYYVQVLVGAPPQAGTVVLNWTATVYPAAPANDDFANAETIAGPSGSFAPIDVSSATVEVGDPEVFGDIWFDWTAPASGLAHFRLTGNAGTGIFGTSRGVFVFTGATLGTLVEESYVFQGGVDQQDTVIDAVVGTTYRIAVVAEERLDGGAFPALAGLDWVQPGPTANDDFADATDMSGGVDGSVGPLASLGATIEEPDEPDFGFEWSVWLVWDGAGDEKLRVSLTDVDDPDNAPSIRVFNGGPTMPDLNYFDETSFPDVSVDLEPGQPWFVQVGWYTVQPQEFTVEWLYVPAPRTRLWRPTPPVRYLLCDRGGNNLSILDGIAKDRRLEYVLNDAATANGTVPADDPRVNLPYPDPDDDPYLQPNSRLLFVFFREGGSPPWRCWWSGTVLRVEDEGADAPTSRFTAYDQWMILNSRPLLNGDGELPGKDGLSFSATRGDVIAMELLGNTIAATGPVGIETTLGTIEETAELDIKFQQGITLGEAWKQLTRTGTIDIVLDPLYDPFTNPGVPNVLSIYARAGQRRDNVIFGWDKAPRSLAGISRLLDGTLMANKVQLFAGQGGDPVPVETDAASVAKHGEYWLLRHMVGRADNPDEVSLLALAALELRKNGHRTISADPTPARSKWPRRDYRPGDVVPYWASRRLRQPITPQLIGGEPNDGYQRIYGIPIDVADDGTATVKQLLTALEDAT